MEYANTFSLDFPVELWRPFAQDRPSVRCSSGYLIYLQGTEATCFYYLKKGKVKSFIQSEDCLLYTSRCSGWRPQPGRPLAQTGACWRNHPGCARTTGSRW